MRYDNAGRLNSVTDPNGSYTYAYLANSNLRSAVTGPVHTATYTYELYRDVITSLENKVGVTTVSKYDYTVNNLGQRTQRANSGTAFGTASTDVFTYNAKGKVVGSTNATLSSRDQSFNYDDIGNRLTFTTTAGTTSYTANSLNQYSGILPPSSSLLTPAYDLDGNQTDTATGQVYIWDAENRLVTVEPLVPTTGDKKQLNTYDAQGRRVRKTVFEFNGTTWDLETDEKFIYDSWNTVAVLGWNSSTSTFDLNKILTWGLDLSGSLQGAGGVGGLLSVKDGGSVYHYTYDANGNVSEVLNNSGGIAAHYEYDAFGNTIASSGTYATTNAYRFSTKPLDSASDLYYYGFRCYSLSAGRWISRDPIEELGGFGLYAFYCNDAVNYVDIDGRVAMAAAPVVGAAAVVFVGAAVLTTPAGQDVINGLGDALGDAGAAAAQMVNATAQAINDIRIKSAERKNYSRRCGEQRPPGLDLCEMLRWEFSRNTDCANMREAFANRWYGGADAAHAAEIARYRASAARLAQRLLNECPCPSIP